MITSFFFDLAMLGLKATPDPTSDPNLWAWFSSDTGIIASNGLINVGSSVWVDRSGNQRNLDVAASQQPTYSTTINSMPNRKPEIIFQNATEDACLTMSSSISSLTMPFSIYMLVKQASVTDNHYMCDGMEATNGFASSGIVQNTIQPCIRPVSKTAGSPVFGSPQGGMVVGTWHVIKVLFDGVGGVVTTQVDNFQELTGVCGNTNPGRLRIGNYGGGGSNGAHFSLGAVIVCLGISSPAMQTLHKNWLANYAGITFAASTGTPIDDPSLFSWHSSDTGLTNAGGVVGTGNNVWLDRSFLARNMDTTAGQEPAYSASGPNGKPMISFLDAGTKTIFQHTSETTLAQPMTVYGLLRANAWTNNRYIWDSISPGANCALLQNGTTPKVQPFAGSFGPAVSPTLSTWFIITVIYDGASSVVQINNAAEVTGDVGARMPQHMSIGNFAGGGSNGAFFDIAAFIVSIGHNGSAIRTLHKNWLAAYGGVSI